MPKASLLACGLSLLAPAAAPSLAAGIPTSIEFLGTADLPSGTRFLDEPVGGLSGLAWDPDRAVFVALSDDSSQHAPARIYELRVDLGSGRLMDGGVTIERRLRLTDRRGRLFPAGVIDPEGFARARDGSFYIGSEGFTADEVPAFVAHFDGSGRLRRRLSLPARYRPSARRARGVRRNLGFESVTLTPDGEYLVAAIENALVDDGPAADVDVASPSRLRIWPLRGRGRAREFLYRVEPVANLPPSVDTLRMNGLVDLLALSRSRLLALEREFVADVGMRIRLYLADLDGATEVSSARSLADLVPAPRPVSKRLLLDFGDLGVDLDNFEGMAFGPRLPDGRRLLLVVSDDNFNPILQRTRFLAFAVADEPVEISAIQGAQHCSPLENRWLIAVEGMVTAVDRRSVPPRFFLESTTPDDDPGSSEAVLVSLVEGDLPEVGQRVRVGGRVEERTGGRGQLPVTTVAARSIEQLPPAAGLPPPMRFGLDRIVPVRIDDDGMTAYQPAEDAIDFWESLEAMRVELPPGIVSGPTRRFGEAVLWPDGSRPAPKSVAGGLLLTESGPAPERVVVSGRLLGGLPPLAVGDRVTRPVAGVVDYSFSSYKLLAIEPLATALRDRACRGATRIREREGALTVSTLNVENLSAADSPARFERIGELLVGALGSPAIVALEEIQDDSGRESGDGVVTARRTLERLTEAVVAAGGPFYRALSIDPEADREGGVPGGNIRVALLFDPLRVGFEPRGEAGPLDRTAPVAGAPGLWLSLNPGRVEPEAASFRPGDGEGVRRSLAAEFTTDAGPLFVIVNHWSSKFDDDRPFGARQPPATPTGARRSAQARTIRSFVEELLALDADARVIVLGDLNDLPWSEPLRILADSALVDLLLLVPEHSRYSYNFEGSAQAIDHVLVSPILAGDAEIEPLHLHSDCPEPLRASDHDPIVVLLPDLLGKAADGPRAVPD